MSPLPLQDSLYPHALRQKFPSSPRARRQVSDTANTQPTDGSSIPVSITSSLTPTDSQSTTSISSTATSNPSITSSSTPKIASGSYPTPTNTPVIPGVNTANDNSTDADSRPNVKAIVFGVLGGILGLLVLLLIILYGLRRRRSSRGKAAFWEKWHWGAYSPVHGDVVFVNQDAGAGVSGERGSKAQVPAQWWQKFNFIGDTWVGDGAVVEGGEQGKKKKKQRTRTLYKVRRLKPNEKFEIDSGADITYLEVVLPCLKALKMDVELSSTWLCQFQKAHKIQDIVKQTLNVRRKHLARSRTIGQTQ
ncbi:hypothetical protein P691DRAFT_788099 [Macrolepiota fuliginosa MF-IS2]|uniref:Uncharacterized protein n=1 Tax=Macrolepiota fuliginosa MF-IS2 TaxID=1400762 RepID=A0A9P5XGI7_9AGAR|nr:hypothetical protein P691DRAFT_788099 [Macrolepiota fuliginosa MF-IS2]